jgi:hypothetical protein
MINNIKTSWRLAPVLALSLAVFVSACEDSFLEPDPPGVLTIDALASPAGIEGAVIGAYSVLKGISNGQFDGGSRFATSYNWVSSSIQGGEANKGTEPGDGNEIDLVVSYNLNATSSVPADKWRGAFEGVTRANSAIRIASSSTDERVTDDFRQNMIAQATFLRAHFFFELHKHFGNIPYFDETVPAAELASVPNTDNLDNIEADFRFAVANLPETQSARGMVNRTAAEAYLGRVLLFQENFTEAATVLQDVIDNGVTSDGLPLDLLPNYSDVFNAESDNSVESIFAIQAAANTGAVTNANFAFDLSHLQGTPIGGCCGFWQPSFTLVNSFRTNNGLPLLDGSFNDPANQVVSDLGVASTDPFTPDAGPLDPRLDHSVGRRDIPYLDWGPHQGQVWIRNQGYGGPYSPKKFIYYQRQTGTLQDGSSWTAGYTAINFNIIRFADVLLMAAEANIENGNLEAARMLINRVRARAANPDSFVKNDDGTDAANYEISTYDAPFSGEAMATDALRLERMLELSNEGFRWFDLVRWGVAAEDLNAYVAFERQFIPGQFQTASTYDATNDMWPIPQGQIDLQQGVLSQNPGY